MPLFLGPPPEGNKPSIPPHTPEEAWKKQQVADIARAVTIAVRGIGAGTDYNSKAITRLAELRTLVGSLDPAPEIMKGFDSLLAAWEDYAATGQSNKSISSQHGNVGYLLSPVFSRYKVALNQVWPTCVGLVQSTPVTDGERVYVAMGPGQVAAYDLAGKQVWAWREVKFQLNGALYCDHTPSLIMADRVLLVRSHFGDLMGIDPKTGHIIHNTDVGASYNHGAFATPGVMQLTSPGGKKLTVVVTQHNKVISAADGRIVATLPHFKNHDVGHGQPRMVWKDLVVLQSSQGVPPDGGPGCVAKLSLADDGTVTATKLHNFGGSKFYNRPAALTSDGNLLGAGGLWKLIDGMKIPGTIGPNNGREGGVVIAGKYAFSCMGSGKPSEGNWLEADFLGWDLSKPGQSAKLPGRRELGFNEVPADIDLDTWLPQLPAAHYGLPYWFGLRNGGAAPSGNRIFMQSTSWMYCIGDPKVPYDWNPESRPKAISRMLTADAAARAKAGPVTGLASRILSERARAAARIRALPGSRKKALIPHLAQLVTADEWPGFNAALEVLGEMGPQAASAAPALLEAARKTLAAKHSDHATVVARTIGVIAPGKQAPLAADVATGLKSSDAAALSAACRMATALGKHAKGSTPTLVKLVAHRDDRVSAAAASALAAVGANMASALPVLTKRMASAKPAALVSLLNALGSCGPKARSAVGQVAAHLTSDDPKVAQAAAEALGSIGTSAGPAYPKLLKAFRHPSREVVLAATSAAMSIAPSRQTEMADALAMALSDRNDRVVQNAAVTLGMLAKQLNERATFLAVDGLKNALRGKPVGTKFRIITALAEFGAAAEPAVSALREEANGRDCSAAAKAALKKINPKGSVDTGPESDVDLDEDLF